MPINRSLLAPSDLGGDIESIRRWHNIRNPQTTSTTTTTTTTNTTTKPESDDDNDNNNALDLIDQVSVLDNDRRESLKLLNSSRSKHRYLKQDLHALCQTRSNADTHKNDDEEECQIEAIRNDIRRKENDMKVYQERVNQLTTDFERMICQIGNMVDEYDGDMNDVLTKCINDGNNDDVVAKSSVLVMDPLWCIGGYDTLDIHDMIVNDVDNDNTKLSILTGIGCELANALQSYATSFLRSSSSSHDDNDEGVYEMARPPTNIKMKHSTLTSIVGTSSTTNNNSSINVVTVPSYVGMSMAHRTKCYSEKRLPLRYILNTNTQSSSSTPQSSSSSRTIPKYAHSMDCTEVFILCECDLGTSRRIQMQIISSIRSFHSSLLVNSVQENQQLLRIRRISPHQLLPSEARRVVVEGYLPSLNTYITLGHVSNFTDYISRSMTIKCGTNHHKNSGGTSEYVHTLHGTFVDSSVTLSWMVENNVVPPNLVNREAQAQLVDSNMTCANQINRHTKNGTPKKNGLHPKQNQNVNDDNGGGCMVSPSLVPFLSSNMLPPQNTVDPNHDKQQQQQQQGVFVIPFVRRLIRAKHGKVIKKTLKPLSKYGYYLELPQKSSSLPIPMEHDDPHSNPETQQNSLSKKENKDSSPKGGEMNMNPTKKQLVAESLCNPYSFLPFLE